MYEIVWVLLSQKFSQVSNCLWHWTWSFTMYVHLPSFLTFPLGSFLSSFPHFNSLFPCFRPSVYLSVCLSFCFFFLTVCLSVYLSIYISGFPSASPFYDHRFRIGGLCLVYFSNFLPGCFDFFFSVDCVDKRSPYKCLFLQTLRMCSSPGLQNFMIDECPKTCNFCGKSSIQYSF